jgi:hypothetical protein
LEFNVNLARFVIWLTIAAVAVPVLLCVLFAVAVLLEAMQDDVGAAALRRVALAGYIAWAVDLVALLLTVAIHSLGPPRNQDNR